MAAKKSNYTDHISKYLKNESKMLGAKGYSEWLSENAYNPSRKYSDAVTEARTAYVTSLPDYVKASDKLSGAGLGKSGYSSYLRSSLKSSYEDALTDAKKMLTKNTADGVLGYEKYINQLSEQREKLKSNLYDELVGDYVTDIDYAYEKALSAGLTEKEARELAKSATSKTRTTLFRRAVSSIISKTLTKEQATEYASSIGLPEKDVEELGMIAHIINQMPASYSKYSGAYINYLKELKNTQK